MAAMLKGDIEDLTLQIRSLILEEKQKAYVQGLKEGHDALFHCAALIPESVTKKEMAGIYSAKEKDLRNKLNEEKGRARYGE